MCTSTGCGGDKSRPAIAVSPFQRRGFLEGLIALPLATVLADSALAQGAAATLDRIEIPTAGGAVASAAIAMPDTLPAPAVLLIHEWWGLNDQIKAVAAEFARQGYVALAVDLYDGEVGASADEARALMRSVDASAATDALASWIGWLREHEATNGKVGTVGWCFGGGWSLNASLAAPVDATVIYYGNVTRTPEQLQALRGPVLGHFGTLDANIDKPMVDGFETAMAAAGKADQLTIHWYDADHAFANPSSARYDEEDAALSWDRTGAFFARHLQR